MYINIQEIILAGCSNNNNNNNNNNTTSPTTTTTTTTVPSSSAPPSGSDIKANDGEEEYFLPYEIWLDIFGYLNEGTLCKLSGVTLSLSNPYVEIYIYIFISIWLGWYPPLELF